MSTLARKLKDSGTSTALDVQYHSRNGSTTTNTTFTFSNMGIGTAASDRYIVVICQSSDNGSKGPSSCTVGGAATTRLTQKIGVLGGAIFLTNAPVTTGTTATIAVTMTADLGGCEIGVYSVRGPVNTTPIDTVNAVSETNPSELIDVVAGGVVIAMGSCIGSGSSFTWSDNLTENYEQNNTRVNHKISGAMGEFTATETVTISCTMSGSSDILHAISLGPT